MTSREFAYWLQGFFEVCNPETISKEQTLQIKNHLNLVFYHEIDPSYTDDKSKQQDMNLLHGKPSSSTSVFSNNNGNIKDELVRC
jgi:hypothetical protein